MKISQVKLVAIFGPTLLGLTLGGCGSGTEESTLTSEQRQKMVANQPLPAQAKNGANAQNDRKAQTDAMRARDAAK